LKLSNKKLLKPDPTSSVVSIDATCGAFAFEGFVAMAFWLPLARLYSFFTASISAGVFLSFSSFSLTLYKHKKEES